VIRTPGVKYGSNPALMYNIPNRRQYYYAKVPTWDGQRHGMDIYKIPQPVPVDIKYTVAIVCNRMRELNKFNQIVLEKFASRQAYQVIKGHYIPIINDGITDESVLDLEKRKVYIQKYEFTLLGFLIDEDEFQVSPAITRSFVMFETDTQTRKKKQRRPEPNLPSSVIYSFSTTENEREEFFNYVANLNWVNSDNVDEYDVFINGDYYGNTISEIQVNNNDTIKIVITKKDNTKDAILEFVVNLI
jgi:hypothetical protein